MGRELCSRWWIRGSTTSMWIGGIGCRWSMTGLRRRLIWLGGRFGRRSRKKKEKQIPFGNDNKKRNCNCKNVAGMRRLSHPSQRRDGWGTRIIVAGEERRKEKQIPFGNDNKKRQRQLRNAAGDAAIIPPIAEA